MEGLEQLLSLEADSEILSLNGDAIITQAINISSYLPDN
jgi:hypothetical protein